MARGTPDYGQFETQTTIIELGNINSPGFDTGFSRMDGGGRVLFFEDFRTGLHRWIRGTSGLGNMPIFEYKQGVAFGYGLPVKLSPQTNSGSSIINSYLSTPLSGKLGLEVGLWLNSAPGQIQMNLIPAAEGLPRRVYGMAIDYITGALKIKSAGTFYTVYTPTARADIEARRISFKMVIDPPNGIYNRVYFNGFRYDLDIPHFGDSGAEIDDYTQINIDASFSVLGFGNIYISHVIISGDEP